MNTGKNRNKKMGELNSMVMVIIQDENKACLARFFHLCLKETRPERMGCLFFAVPKSKGK